MALTDERLREIRAGITTYEMIDGREGKRHHAFPIDSIMMNFDKIRESFKGMNTAANKLGDAFQGFNIVDYVPHQSVTLRPARLDLRGISPYNVYPIPTMPPTLRGTAGLE